MVSFLSAFVSTSILRTWGGGAVRVLEEKKEGCASTALFLQLSQMRWLPPEGRPYAPVVGHRGRAAWDARGAPPPPPPPKAKEALRAAPVIKKGTGILNSPQHNTHRGADVNYAPPRCGLASATPSLEAFDAAHGAFATTVVTSLKDRSFFFSEFVEFVRKLVEFE